MTIKTSVHVGCVLFLRCVYQQCIISPDTLAPHCLVEASVNADIRGSHLLHGELADLLDGAGSPFLETTAGRRGR